MENDLLDFFYMEMPMLKNESQGGHSKSYSPDFLQKQPN